MKHALKTAGEEKKPQKLRRFPARSWLGIVLAVALFFLLYDGLPSSFGTEARQMMAIVAAGITLWIFEVFPLGWTAMLVLLLMLVSGAVPTEAVYRGFASPAVFLIIGGMMLAKAVNETRLSRRISYWVLSRWGGNARGLLASILLIPQIQAFFIPAAAVRTTFLLPVALGVLDAIETKPHSSLRKMILLGVAFGCTVSGTAVLTAAIGNILTVALLDDLLGINITYFEWFLYTFPLWFFLIPATWFVLIRCFPLTAQEQTFPHVQKNMEQKLRGLGPLDLKEWKCIAILVLVVGLWLTEPLHGFHPSIPALFGVLLMALPKVGVARWDRIVQIHFDTVLLLGTTLSMGYALTESGAAKAIGDLLAVPAVLTWMQVPIFAVILVVLFSQLTHLMISNVSTAVVTLIPILIGIALQAGVQPAYICLAAALSCLHGFILVVETMPNVLVHSTGQITQREYLIPGLFLTFISMILTILLAMTWWKWLGLVPAF